MTKHNSSMVRIKMQMLILKYFKDKIKSITTSTGFEKEDDFIDFIFPKNTDVSFGNFLFTIKSCFQYDFTSKKCDRKIIDSNFNIWCEGKLLCTLLPINDLHHPENLVLFEENNFLDIARLIALTKGPDDIRMSIGNFETQRLSHYGINVNSSCEKLESYFTVKDVFPVQSNRDIFVRLSYSASLNIWLFPKCKLQIKNRTACPFLFFVNDGNLSFKVVRDFHNVNLNLQNHVSLRKSKSRFAVDALNKFFPAH